VQPIEEAARRAFNAAQANPANATPEIAQFNVRGGLTFAGVNGEPRGLYETPKKNFMPRIGFAYKLNDKTVVRGGYGIFFGFLGQRRGDVVQSGFGTNTPLNVTTNNGVTFNETLSNPFTSGLQQISGSSLGGQTFLGRALGTGTGGNPTVGFFNSNPSSPYNQRWQVGVQRELRNGLVAEASYVGNRGTHIEIFRNINAIPNQYLSTSPTRDASRITYLTNLVPNPFAGMAEMDPGRRGVNIQRQELLRPHPQFGDVWTTSNEGYSWYHSVQLNLEKRFSKGYTIEASYTFSKFMESTELLTAGDPRPTESISDSDIPHRFAVSGIFELPFGRDRRFFSRLPSVVSHVVSGWQVSGIYTIQSGAPIGVVQNNPPTNWGNLIYIGDPRNMLLPNDRRTLERAFDTTGFVALRTSTAANSVVLRNGQPVWVDFNDPCKNSYNAVTCPGTPLANPTGFNRDASFQLLNNVRTFPNRFGFFRAPRINNFDFGLTKKTRFGDGGKELQFRADLLNAFNHPLLYGNGGVNLDPTSAAFGQVIAGTQSNYPRRIQMTLKLVF
jgi:hypothetical protein